ncbi:right-handed parallel beta-helix repeat-containing protein [Flavihumibacter rivuli]|uniref:parallel beta-helix domain-containing protein n=1 Tax=Flavihumibacter rivuli TaxID=2838156 RepID=UPI001BDEE29E|nr:parallel beta-helix domain-containing protein [Flavihumibacter rivuli]ULQ58165.1 right-handed parallel beta-helix repeat-containing protein [Flavihumibacter rivuli]
MKRLACICFTLLGILPACFAQMDVQKKLMAQFIDADNNSVIELPEGSFTLNASLWLDGKKGVTIRGKGMDKTILNFNGQLSGAEGIKVTNGSNITIEDLTVQDTKGDAIKTQLVDGITFRKVKAEWTRGANEKNGGYGLYPVQCSKVLIEQCEARGASDAGIYVGQSREIIVRNCRATENVAGIEIENSLYAEVYDNEATNNTGGILIFDLPDLTVKKGGFTKVYNNHVHHNNHKNFAPKGNIVGKVPQGTGIMVLATNNVEVYNNRIINNITTGTAIISYYITENPIKDSSYYPYPSNIFIHDNQYEREHTKATMKGRMGKLYHFKLKFGKNVPHIIYDGIQDEKTKGQQILCIRNNTNASFANIDAANNFRNISREMKPYDCELKISTTSN